VISINSYTKTSTTPICERSRNTDCVISSNRIEIHCTSLHLTMFHDNTNDINLNQFFITTQISMMNPIHIEGMTNELSCFHILYDKIDAFQIITMYYTNINRIIIIKSSSFTRQPKSLLIEFGSSSN